MTKVTELPFLTSLDVQSQNPKFIVVDNLDTKVVPFNNMVVTLADSFYGTNQRLNTTASVRFLNITIEKLSSLTDVQIFGNLKIGGVVDENSNDSFILTNEFNDNTTLLKVRGYKDNYPNTSTVKFPVITGEYSNRSDEFPLNVSDGDNLLMVGANGWSGSGWTTDKGYFPGQLTFYATENWKDTATETIAVGTGYLIATQPNDMKFTGPDIKHVHIKQSWDAESQYAIPVTLFGSGVEGYKDLVKSNSVPLTGEGAARFKFINTKMFIEGVSREDFLGADNPTLPDSNKIVLLGFNRSATNIRRNQLPANHTLGRIEFRGGYSTSATISDTGGFGGEISFKALEVFTATTMGTKFLVSTVNSGTTVESTRLDLTDGINSYSSQLHDFKNRAGNRIAIISTGTSTFNSAEFYFRTFAGTLTAVISPTTATHTLNARCDISTVTSALTVGTTSSVFLNAFKSYMLSRVSTTNPARIRIYADPTSQSTDLGRSQGTAAEEGVNLIAEVITTAGSLTRVVSPGVFGFNAEAVITNRIYMSVTNNGPGVVPITATLTVLKLEI